MALTKEDLQAIGELMNERLTIEREHIGQIMDSKLEPINARLDSMQTDIGEIKEKLVDIDESIGELAEWADTVSVITKVPFAGSSTSIK